VKWSSVGSLAGGGKVDEVLILSKEVSGVRLESEESMGSPNSTSLQST